MLEKNILGILVACVATGFTGISQADSSAREFRFDIARQPITATLREFSKQTGLYVSLTTKDDERSRLMIGPLQGRYTAQSALDVLLVESGLTFIRVNDAMIAVIDRESPAKATEIRYGAKPAFQQLVDTRLGDESASRPEFMRIADSSDSEHSDSATAKRDAEFNRTRLVEEVIVTAQKRSERLQDVPIPVSVVSADALVETSQLRVQDYFSKVPGLGLTLAGNGGEPVINIRGITTGDASNPTVGITIDDVPYGASVVSVSVADIDPSDLARVEVLRGPQGTLYGASSIGGLLKFVTNDPSTEQASGRLQVGGTSVQDGDDIGYSVRAGINVPISSTVAVRASGFTVRDPGYVDNVLTGEKDVNQRESEGGRMAALWRPSDNFSVKLSALIQQSERIGTADIDVTLGEDPKQRSLRNTGIYNRDTEAYSATLSGRLGNVELTSITGYNADEIENNLDLSSNNFQRNFATTLFGVSGVSVPFTTTIEKFTQEVRASIPLGQSVEWLIGGFYSEEDIQRTNDVHAVDPASGNRVGLLLRNSIPNEFEEYAAFTNVTISPTKRFDLQLGGRISENKQTFSLIRSGPVSAIIFRADPFISPEVSSKEHPFTYQVTPRFRVSPNLMMYARVASGYRPGGPNTNCGAVNIPCEFESDTTQNYEVGVKGSAFAGALSFDASLYYIDWKEIQINVVTGGLGYVENSSRARSQGLELSLESHPWTGFTVSAWGAYGDAELAEGFPTGSQSVGRSGDRLPYSSRTSGNLSIEQEFPVGDSASAFVRPSVIYVGDREGAFRTSPVRESYPSYVQVDLTAGLRHDEWGALNVFVTNATDKRGILRSGFDAISPNFVTYIVPRTVGLSFTKSF